MKNLTIISLKYSPGLLKEIIALSKAAKIDQYNVSLLINSKYGWLLDEANFDEINAIQFNSVYELLGILKNLTTDKERKIVFYNFHPANILIRLFRKSSNSFVYVHEPWMEDKYKYGFKRMAMVTVLEKLQKFYAIYTSEQIVVPSIHAKEKAIKYKLKHKKSNIEVCPLMLDITKQDQKPKNSFLFIGRLHGAKAFDPVLNTLKHDPDFKLSVLTTSAIPKSVFKEYEKEIRAKRLNIISKANLSEEEIQTAISSSLAVFKLDTLMTQSGVVALSFALSTPVIARNILGFSQDVDHMKNGFLIDNDAHQSLIEAIQWTFKNSLQASQTARKTYEDKFSPHSWKENWGRVLIKNESKNSTIL